jgi:hypothetical protein
MNLGQVGDLSFYRPWSKGIILKEYWMFNFIWSLFLMLAGLLMFGLLFRFWVQPRLVAMNLQTSRVTQTYRLIVCV